MGQKGRIGVPGGQLDISPLPCILASLARLGIFRQAAAMQRKPLAGEGGRPMLENIHRRGRCYSGGGLLCGGGVTGADVASKACEESKGRGGDSFSVCLTPCQLQPPSRA